MCRTGGITPRSLSLCSSDQMYSLNYSNPADMFIAKVSSDQRKDHAKSGLFTSMAAIMSHI
jgi:hypothetical protein